MHALEVVRLLFGEPFTYRISVLHVSAFVPVIRLCSAATPVDCGCYTSGSIYVSIGRGCQTLFGCGVALVAALPRTAISGIS